MNKRKDFLVVFSFLVLVGTLVFSGCETSRVAPEVGTPNPPAAPAQPLVLYGNVIDSKTNAGISGATVEIFKLDGTKVTTIASGGSGLFSYDVTSLGVPTLKVTATASGYGFSFSLAKIDLTNKSAEFVNIPLDKIQSLTVTVTPTGGTASTPSTESKAAVPVSITVPPGAVSAPTAVTVAAVPVNNVPTPAASTTTSQVGVANLQPAGITFAQPVKLSFPLPYKFRTTATVPLVEYVNGAWSASSLNASVDPTGYVANVNITKTNQYALLDNTKVSGSVSGSVRQDGSVDEKALAKESKVLAEVVREFSSGTLSVNLDGSVQVFRSVTNLAPDTDAPTDEWIFNTIAQRYGSLFALYSAPGTYNFPVRFDIPWPGGAANPNAVNADGSGNKNFPGQSGSWSIKVTFESTTAQLANVVLDNPTYWTVTVVANLNSWRIKSKEWVWTGHNQGAVSYPF